MNAVIAAFSVVLYVHSGATAEQLLLNIVAAVCITLPGYFKGVLGGGDVKLLLALSPAWTTMQLLFAFSAGVISLLLMQQGCSKLKAYFTSADKQSLGSAKVDVPIGTAIFIGAACYEILRFLRL